MSPQLNNEGGNVNSKFGLALAMGLLLMAISAFGADPLICQSEDMTLTMADAGPDAHRTPVFLNNLSVSPTLIKKYVFYHGMISGGPKERDWQGNIYTEDETNILKTTGKLYSNYTTKELWVELTDTAISQSTKIFKRN